MCKNESPWPGNQGKVRRRNNCSNYAHWFPFCSRTDFCSNPCTTCGVKHSERRRFSDCKPNSDSTTSEV